MNRVMSALLASLFGVVDAIRDHVTEPVKGVDKGRDTGAPNPVPFHPSEVEAAPKQKRRRRGRGRRSMVAYRLVKGIGKGGKLARLLDPDRTTLQPVELDVLAAIKGQPSISAFQLESVTGHGKKSIESAVWRLRQKHGLIESVPNGD